ncbi:MAG: imidazole glycerol phosphate synthase subunit HisH [Bacteroidia bacterium]|jgi:glutamine amidotransferase
MIGIVNYGSGNIHAIANIYNRLNIAYLISDDPAELNKASHLILPGVGAFDETMKILNSSGLHGYLDEMVLEKRKPIMGICVGMQLLAEGSEEGNLAGFGWIKGTVKRFDASTLTEKPYLPHLGWNTVEVNKPTTLFNEVDLSIGFYFLHSFYFQCTNQADVLGTTTYGIRFASAVQHDNVMGMQFHPEKSHQNGISLFHNFSKI